MDEIIDELREANQPVPIPLELPDDEDLIAVEEAILLPLSREFKQFLLTVSDVVTGSIEPVTASDPSSHTYLPEVTARAWDMGVPRHYIPICEFNGQYYCVTHEEQVVLWDGDETGAHWDSIWDWAQDVWLAG